MITTTALVNHALTFITIRSRTPSKTVKSSPKSVDSDIVQISIYLPDRMPNTYTHFAPRPVRLGRSLLSDTKLISVSALQGVSGFVREEFGSRVLQQANRAAMLDIEKIESQDCFIPHATMMTFIDAITSHAREDQFGLLLAPHLNIRHYGVWGHYALGAATLGEAIRRAQGSIGYHSRGDQITLTFAEGRARFSYSSAAQGHHSYNHVAWATVGVMLSLCRAYLTDAWKPSCIEVDLPKPRHAQYYEEAFGCPIYYDQPLLALTVPMEALWCRRSASGTPFQLTLEDVARARWEPELRAGSIGTVRTLIHTQVLSGQVSIIRVARTMNTSVRSLQRALNCEGQSFRVLVNDARCRRAAELLRTGTIPVVSIATALGYSSSAHFARAFRSATGQSPTEYAARHRTAVSRNAAALR